MDRRFVAFPFIAAAALVFACGPHPRAVGEQPAPALITLAKGKAPAAARAVKTAPDSAPLDAALAVQRGSTVHFRLAVANASKHRLELNFADGRTRDFVVLDGAGREVWRWSRGRLFTQSVQNKLLTPGDSVIYREQWTAPTPGRYTVVAELRSANFPIARRATFDIPAAAGATRADVAAR